MKIHFKTVRKRYYKALVYFLGMSFLFLSGCKSKTTNESITTNTESQDTLKSISTKKDSINSVSIDSSTVNKKTLKNQNKDTSSVNKKTPVKKHQTTPPSENPVMRPVTAYGIQTNDYKITEPTENKKPNE